MDLIQSQMKPKILEEKEPADSQMQSYKNKLTKPLDTSPVNAFLEGKKCLTGVSSWKKKLCAAKFENAFSIAEIYISRLPCRIIPCHFWIRRQFTAALNSARFH
jgi:hypothetical protein